MAVKLTVTPSTNYIEDSINIKITGATASQLANAELYISVLNKDIESGEAYGAAAFIKEKNLSNNFNVVCPSTDEQSPSGVNYGLPGVYFQDFLQNTDKLNYVYFDVYVNGSSIIQNDVRKTLYIKPQPPTFDNIPIYEDINPTSVNFSNNNQMIVHGLSKLKISNINATAYKGATLKSIIYNNENYSYSDAHENGITSDMLYSVDKNHNPWLYIDVVDSRNLKTRVAIANVSKYIYTYQPPKIKELIVERDGIGETTILKAKGYYSVGYQVGTNILNSDYNYKENVSGTNWITGTTNLRIKKTILREYEDFLAILNQFNNPTYQTDGNNLQYYDKQTFENGIDVLFSTAISYNNNYTQEYLQADYDSTNERYYCKSGSYNGSWKAFWQHTLEILYNIIYENGGNYEFEIVDSFDDSDVAIQGDIQNGFSVDKVFNIQLLIADMIGETSQTALLPTAIPAIDVYKDKVAFHGLFDDTLNSNVQINGGNAYGEVLLYEGNTNGNVTLSDNASNYNYIEIFYTDNNNSLLNSTKILAENGKSFLLNFINNYKNASGTLYTYLYIKKMTINNNILTKTLETYFQINGTNPAQVFESNYIYITKVVGYK